jgi:hypothetical protein
MVGECDVPVASGYAISSRSCGPLWPWRRLGRTGPVLAGKSGHRRLA